MLIIAPSESEEQISINIYQYHSQRELIQMYHLQTLKNKLKFITIPVRGTKTATILLMVGAGSKYEARENNGISHFLEHMFFKGTKKRPNAQAITGELDSVGAEFNAYTSKEYTGYWVKVDSSKIRLAADIVSDMLLHSKFSSAEINREKGVIIEEINMKYDNPMMYIEDVFESCLYGNTPAGWDVIGTKRNILKLRRQHFLKYLTSQYGANNTVVCLAGNIRPSMEKLVKQYFSKFKKSDFKDKLPVEEKQIHPQIKLHYKKTDQATLSLGVRTWPINHRYEFVTKLMSILLGGSLSSRLFTEVRERLGLAYYVRTQAEFYTDTGYLTTQAGVPIRKVEQAIKAILSEYKKLTKTLVSQEELIKTRDLIRGRSMIQFELSDNMASWYARQAILRDKILTPQEFFKKINKATVLDIKRIAQQIFTNQGLNLAIIGPFKDKKKFEKILKL